jgi:hypothetical protein
MVEQEQVADFRRTLSNECAVSICLKCGASLLCAPAQAMKHVEDDHRKTCSGVADQEIAKGQKP